MEYEVIRVCESGRVVPQHVRIAGRTRGSLSIQQESDKERHRAILVAHLTPAQGYRSIPPLYDTQLIGTSGDRWMLVGYERVRSGPLAQEYSLGQTWIIEPAPVQDLIDVEAKWTKAVREANELREHLRTLTEGPRE